MTIIRLYDLHGDAEHSFADMGLPELHEHSGKHAHFAEVNGHGNLLVINGKGLGYDNGHIVAGTITGMTLFNADGEKLAMMTGATLRASALEAAYFDGWARDTAWDALAGNDTLFGSEGEDWLFGNVGDDILKGRGDQDRLGGNQGHDTLTGGASDDFFSFSIGDGRDTITDFRKHGDFDTIIVNDATSYTAQQRGNNTLLKFDNGTSALLLDFDKQDLQPGDIQFM